MTATLAHIFRHPIKAVGHEELPRATLTADRALAFDRHWAVAHAQAKFGHLPAAWAAKMNFLRGVAGPQLMAITCRFDPETGDMVLDHPTAGRLSFRPDGDTAPLIAWLGPLWPETRPAPAALVTVAGQAMTDVPDPWLAVLNLASNRALGAMMGVSLSPHRWRGNLWIDGLEPFSEFGLVGRRLRIGTADAGSVVLEIRERITRCKATCVNPDTGVEDADTLGALQTAYGHQDFGVYAAVKVGGDIAPGDPVTVMQTW